MTDRDDPLPLVRDLAILARAAEVRGAYNGGKLLRALLDAELTRLALRQAPADDAAVAEAVTVLAKRLGAASPGVTEALERTAAVIRDGGILALADVAPASVCRSCGQLFLGEVPLSCPTCEAPASAFREHLPIWFLEPMAVPDVLEELEAGLERVESAVADREDATLDRPPRAGEWSARQTLEHLLTTEQLFATRVERLLREDEPDLAAWSVGQASDEATEARPEPASTLAARWGALRAATIERLRMLDDADWARAGRHPEWGTVTVRSQAAYFARHLASHTAQLAAAAQGRVPGDRLPT
jgi:uncharacterized damage-inducible protein DinB